MDRRNNPAEFWGQSVTFWWRLWQNQLEYSIRFWGAMAERMPHPSAADLAAEAEAMRELCEQRERRGKTAGASKRARPAERSVQQLH